MAAAVAVYVVLMSWLIMPPVDITAIAASLRLELLLLRVVVRILLRVVPLLIRMLTASVITAASYTAGPTAFCEE